MSKKKKRKAERTLHIRRKEAPFAPQEQLGEYHLRRWRWLAKRRASEKATTAIDRERGIVQWDTTVYYTEMLLASVIKVPSGLEWNRETIEDLDPDVGDALNKAAVDLNEVSGIEKKNFLGQLPSGAIIPGSTPTGPVKPSESSPNQEA